MDDFEKFYPKALRFLSFRPRSEKEMQTFLLEKDTPQKIIEKIIARLKEKKYLNDEEFAMLWIEQRKAFRPKSMRVIAMELKQKGIGQEIIDTVMKKAESDVPSDLESAKKIVSKKFDKYKHLPKQEIYQKLGAFLARRGFDWETIKKSIDSEMDRD